MKCNDNATCLLGSGLARDALLFNKIVEHKTPVVLALDSDMKSKTMSLAKRLHEFDIQVRILKTDGFDDVGAMSKKEFLKRKDAASLWLPFDNLKFKISNLATGSMI
jgi:cellulose synthase/poly-beta-1,6-N-acetylglucosamine synthase-like glycosyltransferase